MVHPDSCESGWDTERGTPDQDETRFGSEGFDGGSTQQKEHAHGKNLRVWPKTLEELLIMYPCCPPEAFFNIKEFYYNHKLNQLKILTF